MATATERKTHVFNLPNQLTLARFVLALVLFALIAFEHWDWCVVVFCLAAITDYLDGYFARLHGICSSLGRNLDPLVDKVLMCGTYVFLLPRGAEGHWLEPWMVTVVVARELIITSLRSYVENLGGKFGADWMGKVKMGLQCAAVIAIFVVLTLEARHWEDWLVKACARIRDGLIWAMLATTLLSGLQYLWKAAALYRDGATH